METELNTGKLYSQRPMLSAEEREKHCEMLAYDLAQSQLEKGTASTQVIVHFLRLATAREEAETRKAEADVRLAEAKIAALESTQKSEEATNRVLAALRKYQGSDTTNDIGV